MTNMKYGTRFSGSACNTAGYANIRGPENRWSPGHRGWWNPERDAKLVYVMSIYNDMNKAARVLGTEVRLIADRWTKLFIDYRENENQYEKYMNSQPKKLEKILLNFKEKSTCK